MDKERVDNEMLDNDWPGKTHLRYNRTIQGTEGN